MTTLWLEPEAFPAFRRRLKAERIARNLTPARRDALLALLAFYGPEGLYPSDATVAAATGCSARTVRRARADAVALGLRWDRTRKLVNGRYRQGPNRYWIDAEVVSLTCDPQTDRKSHKDSKKDKKEAWKVVPSAPPRLLGQLVGGVDLLKLRREATIARLAQETAKRLTPMRV